MAKRKKKGGSTPQKFSPLRYIKEKARSFPIHKCRISKDYRESGIAEVYIIRQQPSGKLLLGLFLVDIFCLGVKNALWKLNLDDYELEDFMMGFRETEECEYVFAHNLIYGAIAYAEDLGFQPHKDFGIAQYVLEEDTDEIELIEMEFGKDGMPFFISGLYDDVHRIKKTLDRTVGPDNWHFIVGSGPPTY